MLSGGSRVLFFYALMRLIYRIKRMWVRDEVIISPSIPRNMFSLWKICTLSGIKMVSEGRPTAPKSSRVLAHIRHDNDTWDSRHPGFVNGQCTDISKSRVDEMLGNAFGYTTRIDPTTYRGRAVMKSEANYSGGGTFVDCPIASADVKDGHIYQKLVENEIEPGVVKEFRVSIICGEITDVIVQFRSIDKRLTGRGSGGGRGSYTTAAREVFSPEELSNIIRFCEYMGLDFGELDILPDVTDGRLYILDANKTPTYMVQASAFRVDRFLNAYRRGSSFRRLLLTRQRAISDAPVLSVAS